MRLKTDAVSWAPTEDESIVVLDLRSSMYLSLNASGSVLWQRLSDGASQQELVQALVDRFDVTHDVAARDVQVFLETVRERGLLEEQ